MPTLHDVYKQIEEVFATQIDRDMKKLLDGEAGMSNEELHNLRGRAISSRYLLRTLRNTLGYDPTSL